MSDSLDTSTSPTPFERLVRSRWYGAGGIAGLSKLSGVSRATLYSWFRGETVPDTKSLARLASVLDISLAELVEAVGAEVEAGADTTANANADAFVPAPVPAPVAAPAAAHRFAAATESAPRLALESSSRRGGPSRAGPRIEEVLPPQQVTFCEADDPIGPIARTMYERHYSQAPVRDAGHWMGLLTTEAIARWMAGRSRTQLDVEPRAPVREVLAYADDAGDVRIVPGDMPVGDVVTMFDAAALRGQPLRAVLVASPRAAIPPRGIVTASDLTHLRRMASHQPSHTPSHTRTANLSRPTERLTREPDERGQDR